MAPLRIVEKFTELSNDEGKDLFLTVQKVQKIIEQVHNTSSSTIVIQDGKDAGQTIKVRIINFFFNTKYHDKVCLSILLCDRCCKNTV